MKEVSERLQELSPRIMDVWIDRTLKEVKAAYLQDDLALRNSIPVYLTQLVKALQKIDRTAKEEKSDKDDSTRIGKKHGAERAKASKYTIDQMIFEYHILRQVVCDLLEEVIPLSPGEREIIVSSVEQAVNDAATQFSQTVGDFQDQISHTLAHDVRNPLMTLKISAQMLVKQTTRKDHLEKLERILHSVDRMDSMIQEVLDESRMSAIAREPLELVEFDLTWLIKDVAYELNISHADRFEVKATGPCRGRWNENSLRRVVENLATNAVKHGSATASVTLSVSQTKNEATIKVHNEGNPILPEEQDHLFQKFKRAYSAEKKIGWGIGLSIVKLMVDAHHGNIKVESDETTGTTFSIILPKVLVP